MNILCADSFAPFDAARFCRCWGNGTFFLVVDVCSARTWLPICGSWSNWRDENVHCDNIIRLWQAIDHEHKRVQKSGSAVLRTASHDIKIFDYLSTFDNLVLLNNKLLPIRFQPEQRVSDKLQNKLSGYVQIRFQWKRYHLYPRSTMEHLILSRLKTSVLTLQTYFRKERDTCARIVPQMAETTMLNTDA